MSISIRCPGCEKRLKAKDELAGKRVKCPGCGHRVLIPGGHSPAQQEIAISPSPKQSLPSRRLQATVTSAVPGRSLRRRYYAGGGAAFLCVLSVVILVLVKPGKDLTPAKNEMAVAAPAGPDPKLEPKSGPKPDPNAEPRAARSLNLRAIRPIAGVPVDRGTILHRVLDSTPSEVLGEWVGSLKTVTALTPNQVFERCIGLFGCMSILFDEKNAYKKDVGDKLLKRLDSIKYGDLQSWSEAVGKVIGGSADKVAVALTLLPMDKLYENDRYLPDQGKKYVRRLNSVPKEAVERWVKEVKSGSEVFDAFDGGLDAMMNIVLLDELFQDDQFSAAKYEAALKDLKKPSAPGE